jgi:hypothetical protein
LQHVARRVGVVGGDVERGVDRRSSATNVLPRSDGSVGAKNTERITAPPGAMGGTKAGTTVEVVGGAPPPMAGVMTSSLWPLLRTVTCWKSTEPMSFAPVPVVPYSSAGW